jgi:hypothetical protein
VSGADSMAKELMDLVTIPSALVTGTFLTFAGKAIKDNQADVDVTRMCFATLASVAALGITCALAALMAPLAYRSLFVFRGGIDSTLIVFWMIFMSVVGTAVYSGWTLIRCVCQLRRPSR